MNTPDTEWRSKSVEIWEGKETPKEIAHAVVTHFSDFISTKIEEDIETVIERLISSRDTYWKERVRKTVGKIEESARTQDTSYEYGEGTYEGMMHSIFILKDITNEDNLK